MNVTLSAKYRYMYSTCIVEQAVSALKVAIKADISRPEIQALQRNIGTITVAKCGQWFRFMQTYLPRCINNEAIEG